MYVCMYGMGVVSGDKLVAVETKRDTYKEQLTRIAASGVKIDNFSLTPEEISTLKQDKGQSLSLSLSLFGCVRACRYMKYIYIYNIHMLSQL